MQLSELSEERCKTNVVLGDLHRDFKHLEALNRPHMLFTRRNPVIMTYSAPFQSLDGFSYCIRNSCSSSKTFESCMSEFGIAWIVMPSLCCFHVFIAYFRSIVECNARIHPDSCTKMKALLSVLHFPSCANPLLFQNSDIFPWWFVWIFLFWEIFRQKPFRHSHPKQASNQMKWYMASCLYRPMIWIHPTETTIFRGWCFRFLLNGRPGGFKVIPLFPRKKMTRRNGPTTAGNMFFLGRIALSLHV